MHYPDNFYLDLEMDNDSPVTFRIDDASGKAVYTNSDKKIRIENRRIWLKRGDYRIAIASETGEKASKMKNFPTNLTKMMIEECGVRH